MPSGRSYLLSELETGPGLPTLQGRLGVDRFDVRYKVRYFARQLSERLVKNPTLPFYFLSSI